MPTWKKVLVSGSAIEVSQLNVGAGQQITTAQGTTFLTGSFTGSFVGSGAGLTGVTATAVFPTTLLTPLTSTTQIFANDGSNKYVTAGQITASAYAGVSGDITISTAGVASIAANSVALGTDTTGDYVASITSGNGLTGGTSGEGSTPTLAVGAGTHITVNPDDVAVNTTTLTPVVWAASASYTGSIFTQVSGDITISAAGVSAIGAGVIVNNDIAAGAAIAASKINFASTGIVSGSSLSSAAQGEVALTTNGVAASAIDLGLQTTDSPQFVGLTLTGDLAVNGADITTTSTGTATLFNTNATTVNIAGAGTTVNIGNASGTTTIAGNAVVQGDFTVNGTTTYVNVQDLYVEDKFIVLASGSATSGDGGIIIDRGSDAAGNIAFGFDSVTDRWGFQDGLTDSTNTFDPTSASGVSGSFVPYLFTEASHGATKPVTGEFAQLGAQYMDAAGNFWVYTV